VWEVDDAFALREMKRRGIALSEVDGNFSDVSNSMFAEAIGRGGLGFCPKRGKNPVSPCQSLK